MCSQLFVSSQKLPFSYTRLWNNRFQSTLNLLTISTTSTTIRYANRSKAFIIAELNGGVCTIQNWDLTSIRYKQKFVIREFIVSGVDCICICRTYMYCGVLGTNLVLFVLAALIGAVSVCIHYMCVYWDG